MKTAFKVDRFFKDIETIQRKHGVLICGIEVTDGQKTIQTEVTKERHKDFLDSKKPKMKVISFRDLNKYK